jgi:hypothetical protein
MRADALSDQIAALTTTTTLTPKIDDIIINRKNQNRRCELIRVRDGSNQINSDWCSIEDSSFPEIKEEIAIN